MLSLLQKADSYKMMTSKRMTSLLGDLEKNKNNMTVEQCKPS